MTTVVDEEPDAAPAVDGPGPERAGRSASLRTALAPADAVIAGATLFLLIANGPRLNYASPVLLTLVAWPLGAAGIGALALLAWRGDVAARWGSAFLAWAALATALSAQPRLAFYAGYSADRGWVYLAAFIGCWAVGRRRSTATATLVTWALLLGLFLNAGLALLQTLEDGLGLLALRDGRAMGFTMNSVFLGGLMAGAMALTSARCAAASRRWWVWLPAVTVAAFTANLAGSRAGIFSGVVLAVAAARRGGAVRIGGVVAALVIGLLVSAPLLSVSATSRLGGSSGGGGGLSARVQMWEAGIDAAADRPMVGFGPNRFRAATNRAVDAEFVQSEPRERVFFDAHNVAVEVLVATGLPGLVLCLGFAWAVARRARGPLAWYAAGVACTWLLEPVSITTAPTVMLALGLAALDGRAEPDPPPANRSRRLAFRAVSTLLVVMALVAGGRLLYVDHLYYVDEGEISQLPDAEHAAALMPKDPAVVDALTESLAYRAYRDRTAANRAAAIRSAERAVRLDPTYSFLWVHLARVRYLYGSEDRAERLRLAASAYEAALDRSPWSVDALTGLYQVRLEQRRVDDARLLFAQLCAIDACPRPHT